MMRIPLTLFAAIAIATPTHAQQQPLSIDTAALRAVFDAEMTSSRVPGAALAVVSGDKVIFSTAAGVRNIETGDAMTTASLVRIGSITKSFTGLAAATLSANGKLDLHAPIGRIANVPKPLQHLTLHQLLTHTSGMADEGARDGSHDDSALEARIRHWGSAQLFADTADIYSYSSPGFWLAGYVLQQMEKTPFADMMQSNLLVPLGMTSSTYRPLVALTRYLAVDHRVSGARVEVLRPFQDDASTWPSGSLFSNVIELSRYAIALMNGGRIDGVQPIPRSAVHAMLEKRSGLPDSPCAYSYGLSICDRGRIRTVSHYGFRVGSGAVFTMVPDARVSIVVLANRNGAIFRRTEQEFLRQVESAAGGAANAADAASTASTTKANNENDFLGSWGNGGISFEVLRRSDSLFYRYDGVEQRATISEPNAFLVLDAAGNPVQQFLLIPGRRSTHVYLHDGLNAFSRRKR